MQKHIAEIIKNIAEIARVAEMGFYQVFQDAEQNVVAFPPPQLYVIHYRDFNGFERYGVVSSIQQFEENCFSMKTSRGILKIGRSDILDWLPVLEREKEPYPIGWHVVQ